LVQHVSLSSAAGAGLSVWCMLRNETRGDALV
jgi:hypothetical protein